MDEEMMGQMAPRPMPQTIGISLAAIAGEFLLFLGLLFMMLGIAALLTDLFQVAGIGEIIVGLLLVAGASVLLLRSMRQVRKVRRRMPHAPMPPKMEKKDQGDNTASYR